MTKDNNKRKNNKSIHQGDRKILSMYTSNNRDFKCIKKKDKIRETEKTTITQTYVLITHRKKEKISLGIQTT